jgi:hypothetical protein
MPDKRRVKRGEGELKDLQGVHDKKVKTRLYPERPHGDKIRHRGVYSAVYDKASQAVDRSARRSQKSSNRPLNIAQRRAMIASAP